MRSLRGTSTGSNRHRLFEKKNDGSAPTGLRLVPAQACWGRCRGEIARNSVN